MSNTIPKRKILQTYSAEMDRKGSKAYRFPLQFPVSA